MGEDGRERGEQTQSRFEERPLLLLHSEETILANPSLAFWQAQPTEDIVQSLLPEASRPLMVGADGTILDGNTRIWVLRQRGHDVDSLPRTIYVPRPLEEFDG